MARQWPGLSKLTHPVRRSDDIIFVTVKTQMFCNEEIEQHEEAAKNREFSTKDKLSNTVTSIANRHIRNCDKCKKHYG